MSQTEFFIEPATILRMPSWLESHVHEDRELPLARFSHSLGQERSFDPGSVQRIARALSRDRAGSRRDIGPGAPAE
jgi:hypothetical protein